MTINNFSQEELEKFNAMAPNWWDETGPMLPLHKINPIRVDYILNQNGLKTPNSSSSNSSNILANINILDIGCGGGILSEALAKLGANVTGIDMAKDAIDVAKLHAASNDDTKNLTLNYQAISLEEFIKNNPEKKFDIITCLELIEHVPDPPGMIANLNQLLKPESKLFISTLNRNLKSYMLSIVGAEYILNMIPKGTHEYSKFIKPSELASILRKNNLKINDIKGIVYNPFTKQFKLSNDTDVNYITSISR